MEAAGQQEPPRWPAWTAPAAFVTVFLVTGVVAGILGAAIGGEPGEPDPAFTVAATFAQALVFVATAILFAALAARPRLWHFGLRRARFWPTVGVAVLGMLAFYLVAATYAAAVQPDVEQDITEDLGADQGTAGLIVAGCVVMLLAPVAEEVFFRGFFYRALRTRFGVLSAAALDGVLFGLIHYPGDGAEGLLILPPLGFLGFVFCLVYERTGSLYPVIAMHAVNNALAYGVQTGGDGWIVSAVVGPLAVAGVIVAARALPPGPHRAVA